MERTKKRLVSLGLIAVMVLLAFAVACGGGGASSASDSNGDEAEHVEGDEHDANGDGDGDEEASAYLEVAAKDVLYLVKMTNFAYTPEVLEVSAGDVLEIAIQNVEPVLHDFTIDKIGADVHISYLGGTGQHAHVEMEMEMDAPDVHFALTEPGSGVVHLRVFEPGEYVFYCTVPGHREAGMVGTLIVGAPEGEAAHEEGDADEADEHESDDHAE
jgi:uncharacterized cupredoxin-like copper-binding protein